MPSRIRLEALLSRLDHPGILSGADLRARHGAPALRTAITHGDLIRLARDVYAPRLFAESLWVRAAAALHCTGPEGVVSGRAALFLWRAIEVTPPTVLVALDRHHHVTRRPAGTRYLRVTAHPPAQLIDGLAVAEPEWALLHAMREVQRRERRDLALFALGTQAVAAWRLAELVESQPHALGRAALRGALSAYGAGIHSPLEWRGLRDVLRGNAFAHLKWQYRIRAGGRSFRVDAFDEQAMLAIEFDGARYHTSAERWQADRERDTLLAAQGVLTLRLTHHDVTRRPQWCRRLVLQAREQRMRATLAS